MIPDEKIDTALTGDAERAGRFVRRPGRACSLVSHLLRQKEGETQIHVDQKDARRRCARMAEGKDVGRFRSSWGLRGSALANVHLCCVFVT